MAEDIERGTEPWLCAATIATNRAKMTARIILYS